MKQLFKYAWAIAGAFALIGAAIYMIIGETIRIIGIGLTYCGGAAIRFSEYLMELAGNWLTKEPAEAVQEEETEEVVDIDPVVESLVER